MALLEGVSQSRQQFYVGFVAATSDAATTWGASCASFLLQVVHDQCGSLFVVAQTATDPTDLTLHSQVRRQVACMRNKIRCLIPEDQQPSLTFQIACWAPMCCLDRLGSLGASKVSPCGSHRPLFGS